MEARKTSGSFEGSIAKMSRDVSNRSFEVWFSIHLLAFISVIVEPTRRAALFQPDIVFRIATLLSVSI